MGEIGKPTREEPLTVPAPETSPRREETPNVVEPEEVPA